MIEIPNFASLDITDIICDYNGTIAKDGKVLPAVKALFDTLSLEYSLHVITADTFGTVEKELLNYPCKIKTLSSNNHTEEKADYIRSLGVQNSVALGNGNNDALLLEYAAVGIALIGDEGCSTKALLSADVVCKNISDALGMLINTKRMIATLRK